MQIGEDDFDIEYDDGDLELVPSINEGTAKKIGSLAPPIARHTNPAEIPPGAILHSTISALVTELEPKVEEIRGEGNGGHVGFLDLPRWGTQLGEIEQIQVTSIEAQPTGNFTAIIIKAFRDGSPFLYEVDSDSEDLRYDIVVLPEHPPFVAKSEDIESYTPQGGGLDEGARRYLQAVRDGEESLRHAMSDKEANDIIHLLHSNKESLENNTHYL